MQQALNGLARQQQVKALPLLPRKIKQAGAH